MRHLLLFTNLLLFLALEVNADDIRKGKDYALFFAVQDYGNWEDLRNPIRDAEAIAEILVNNFDFDKNNVEIVRNPTKKQIQATLNDYLTREFEEDAQLFIFFSGHGEFNDLTKEGFFVPKNAEKDDPYQESYFAHTRLERSISNIRCPHVLLAIDACYSGTFDEEIATERLKSGKDRDWRRPGANSEYLKEKWIKGKLKNKSRLFLTSGGKERTPDGIEHSPFTIGFLNSLVGVNLEDGILTFDELRASMKNVNPEPRAGIFGDHYTGGNFLFIRSQDKEPVINVDEYNRRSKDLSAWEKAKVVNTVDSYQDYLDENLNGSFREEARKAIRGLQEKLEWELAKSKNTIEAYEKYIRTYPNGFYLNEAIQLQNELTREANKEVNKFIINSSAIGAKEHVDEEVVEEDLLSKHSMIRIEGDTFSMGCFKNSECYAEELPLHLVKVNSFMISQYEITNNQFVDFLNTQSKKSRFSGKKNRKDIEQRLDVIYWNTDEWMVTFGYENHPVLGVTWQEAVDYCKWLNNDSEHKFRLPTEAEWEFAAKGGRKSRFLTYAGAERLEELYLVEDVTRQEDISDVGKTKPNELGLYDMSSNAYEWVQDCGHNNYEYAPNDGAAWLEEDSGNCSYRIVRGGRVFERKIIYKELNHAFDDLYDTGEKKEIFGFRIVHEVE